MRYFLVTISFIMMIIRLMKIFLNNYQRERGITEELLTFYSRLQYDRWMNYEKKRDKFNVIKIVFHFFLNCSFYLSSFYSVIHGFFPENIIINSIGMILVVYCIESLIDVIFEYYWNFRLEEIFRMNRMTLKTFLGDVIKNFILDIFIIVLLVVFVHYVHQWFDIYGFLFIGVCGLVVVHLIQNNSLLILKIYNQFTPLEEGELKNRIMKLVSDNGFKIKGIYVMDASKRTKRANAFCLGDYEKEICIDDNMLKYYSDEEILSVFAHELGHAVYNHSKDIKKINYLRIIFLFILSIVLFLDSDLYVEFGINNLNYCMIMVLLNVFVDPMMFLLSIPYNQLLRRNELEADRFSFMQGYGKELKNILIKLSSKSLSDMNPHPLVVSLTYTHPTVIERIKNIEKIY